MKYLFFIILFVSLTGCYFDKQEKTLADLTLYFDSDIKVDSILVTNITQDREFHTVKYSDNINVNLNDSINDLYAINFFVGNDHRMVQLWLNGENLIIKGKVFDKIKIQVDTVIGSDLYNKSLDFRKKYKDLLTDKPDSIFINNFLIAELKKEINSPFSIEIAQTFMSRNISNANELKKLFTVLSMQNDLIKSHLLNPYRKLENILSVTEIDFSKYKFYDRDNTLTSISLSDNKKYLIDFWFIGCAPCIQDHKSIIKKLNSLNDKNVEIIGISIDRDQEQWKDFLNEKQYPWKNYREVDEHENRMRTKMMIDVYPTYLILDSKGFILYRSNGFSDIERYLGI
ncbi:MAG: TlpA family protein disulfide reductase [Saprospiraceae bacterium]|nr:TlpA family protein disulfide reductase [Saprospiraceae bacterium]